MHSPPLFYFINFLFQTEYPGEYYQRLEYISGFTGSTGDAVITNNKAILWTDGRYHVQADNELSCDWELMRLGYNNTPQIFEFLIRELPKNSRVGIDPTLISYEIFLSYKSILYKEKKIHFVPIKKNLIDIVWLEEGGRPLKSKTKAYVWNIKFAGVPWQEKVEQVRGEMRKMYGVEAYIVTSLDDIAWLLNIRGEDVSYSPLVESYVILSLEEVHLYIDLNKVTG